ncbi:cell wall-binding repeat-containing protein [Clostridium tetanomorphum]|uniref:Cell wall-binding repeat-containing protein n=1 Tax=Clostridium tetanomorphum TaxID=1553 RepID=A0A923IZ85_CLOTT|nr:cell wall-binding repeat-containing protein [Clostridium tetanomorphum]MBC2397106.1 cell wall-binding repeat-containing protein [Clostridium tetanomorphum]NRZ99050.1 putative cell wall-binding protein [Clostridium tetanomorphum]
MSKINFSLRNFYKKFSVMITMALILSPIGAKAEGNSFQRLNGKNRYETASAISKHGWTQSQYILIANGENFPDALCSVPLAKKYNAPILLTNKNALSKEAEEEIKRLGAKNIILVGGEGSISLNTENYIKTNFKGSTVERIWGKDRYETSLKIAQKLEFKGDVVVASSMHYADALSIAPVAAKNGMPILLTAKDKLSDGAKTYLKDKKVNKTYVIGGEGVISKKSESELNNVVRISGKDRFQTNVEILKAFQKDAKCNNVFVALGQGPKGNEFADALAGAALAAKVDGAMVLSAKDLPKDTEAYLKNSLSSEAKIFALGGEGVLPNTAVEKIKPAANSNNNDETKPSTETSGNTGNSNTGSNSGSSETPAKENKFKVDKFYLKGSDGYKIDGEVKDDSLELAIPKDYKEKITNVVFATSNSINNVTAMGQQITKEQFEKIYGKDAKEFDLILYLRHMGFDKEGDGVGLGNISLLNGSTIILKDDKNNEAKYKLVVKSK